MYAETAGLLDHLSREGTEKAALKGAQPGPFEYGRWPLITWELYSACIRHALIAILYE